METPSDIGPNPELTDESENKSPYTLYDMVRRLLLAGIGVMAITYDEMEEFVDRLVERGELAKRDGEKLLNEARDRRRKSMKSSESYFQEKREEIYRRINVPSKKDFDELSAKISILERKIDDLTRSRTDIP